MPERATDETHYDPAEASRGRFAGQPAEHALLGLLSLAGGTAHGYELARRFERGRPLGEVLLQSAMLYKHLKKLARLGWVTLSFVDQAPRPPRQLCQLTPAGEAELRRWLGEPVARTREVRLEFLVKLYFAWRLEPAKAERLARDQREIVLGLAESLAEQLDIATQLARIHLSSWSETPSFNGLSSSCDCSKPARQQPGFELVAGHCPSYAQHDGQRGRDGG